MITINCPIDSNGFEDIVRLILDYSKSNAYDISSSFAIYWAVYGNHINIVKLLLSIKDFQVYSCEINIACQLGRIDILKLFLEHHHIRKPYIYGKGLDIAKEYNQNETIKLIQDHAKTTGDNRRHYIGLARRGGRSRKLTRKKK